MNQEDDGGLLTFQEDDAPVAVDGAWKILIVDDEPEVHSVTRLALHDLQFRGRKMAFLSAHSGEHAHKVLAEHQDIALILLDVVMETEDAGLRLARYIREQLGNDRVRIVLRTGQPGQAPERSVVLEYDINDYKEKTELTAQKLITTVISSLRAYQAIDEVARLNRSLEHKVSERTAELERSNTRLKRSLDALEQGERAGRRVQFKLLPEAKRAFHGYRFSHLLQPSEFMSGDFVDYFALDDSRVLFYIADVSGHGVASAFVTVYLKRFIGSAKESWMAGRGDAITDPARLLAQLNQELLRDRVGKHIALFVAVLDTQINALLWANAGAFPYPLLVGDGGSQLLEQRSTPVGLLDTATYENQSLLLPAHFRLLLASDGLLELLPESNTEQKLNRLTQAMTLQLDDADAVARQFGCATAQNPPDDVTLLVLGYDSPP